MIKEYLKRTRLYRNNCSKLFLCFAKPHKEVFKETISRGIRIILSKAGVDTKLYGPHRVRSAVTSKANVNSVPLDVILKKTGWSREKTFAMFYNIEIVNEDNFVNEIFRSSRRSNTS